MRIKGKEDFGKAIKSIRKTKGLTLVRVAKDNPELLTDYTHLDKTERAKQTLRDLDRMSELLEYYGYGIYIFAL